MDENNIQNRSRRFKCLNRTDYVENSTRVTQISMMSMSWYHHIPKCCNVVFWTFLIVLMVQKPSTRMLQHLYTFSWHVNVCMPLGQATNEKCATESNFYQNSHTKHSYSLIPQACILALFVGLHYFIFFCALWTTNKTFTLS